MSYCSQRFAEPVSRMMSSACFVRDRKNPGMSYVLIGSISRRIPTLASSSAAKRRFATNVARTFSTSTPAGAIPARQLTCLHPSAFA